MSLVEPHPKDKGKYQSTFDTYGHGKGNGKSRSMIYKHAKKNQVPKEMSKNVNSGTKPQYNDSDYTKSDVLEKDADFVQNDDSKPDSSWDDIEWLDDNESDLPAPTIPKPIRKLSGGEIGGMTAAQKATQGQLIKWGFMGLDRAITHWGRGVTQKPEWEIVRHPEDYDAMEGATTNLLDSYGVSMELNAELVWATVMTAAYAPPVAEIARHSQPARRQRLWNKITRPSQWFKRTPPQPSINDVIEDDTD
jgi:hypothetical protein